MIFTKTNKNMDNSLKELRSIKEEFIKFDMLKLNEFVFSDFFEIDDTIFLKCVISKKNLKSRYEDSKFTDKEGTEYSENHIHIRNYIKFNKNKPLTLLQGGIIIWNILIEKIKTYYPNENFIIILSYDIKPIRKELRNCVIKFYKIRNNPFEVIREDLEEYCEEAMGYLII